MILAFLPAFALVAVFAACLSRGSGAGRALAATALGGGSVVWAGAEGLSLFGGFGRAAVAAVWAAVLAAALSAVRWKAFARPASARGGTAIRALAGVSVAVALAGAGLAAWHGPPNIVDAMRYHLPRVVYWAQNGSVWHYPSHYYQQLALQPMAEWAMLHLYVLGGGDRAVLFVSWAGFAASIGLSAAVARRLGAGPTGAWTAAALTAVLPAGVLQASGAKPEPLLGLWLLAAAYAALGAAERECGRLEATTLGLAAGFALLTKGTAYAFAPGLAAGLLFGLPSAARWRLVRAAPLALAVCCAVNAPFWLRNWAHDGHPLGDGSVDGDGVIRFANERLGAGVLVSNALRNAALQVALRREWSEAIQGAVVAVHRELGLDPDDPATTWAGQRFEPAFVLNHEGVAANTRHALFLVGATAWLVGRRRLDPAAGLLLGVALAFALFCLLLKWQPWHARMHAPLFVLACPVLGLWAERALPRWGAPLLVAWLLWNVRPAILHNSLRPLTGDRSVLSGDRFARFFVDLPGLERPYGLAADFVAASGCRQVGIDAARERTEYPLVARLLELAPDTRFRHVGVANASARYEARTPFAAPCAVVCLGCAGDPAASAAYTRIAPPARLGQLLVFAPSRGER